MGKGHTCLSARDANPRQSFPAVARLVYLELTCLMHLFFRTWERIPTGSMCSAWEAPGWIGSGCAELSRSGGPRSRAPNVACAASRGKSGSSNADPSNRGPPGRFRGLGPAEVLGCSRHAFAGLYCGAHVYMRASIRESAKWSSSIQI